MKKYVYLAFAFIFVGAFTWYSIFVYKAGWNGHVAAQAVEQGERDKKMNKIKADSAKAVALARKESDKLRRKYRDKIRVLRVQNKEYKDWAAAHIPDSAVDIIWLRRE